MTPRPLLAGLLGMWLFSSSAVASTISLGVLSPPVSVPFTKTFSTNPFSLDVTFELTIPGTVRSTASVTFPGPIIGSLDLFLVGPSGDVLLQAEPLLGLGVAVASLGPLFVVPGNYFVQIAGDPSSEVTVSGSVTILTVPEPSTWAMMLLGFAGLGYAGYRSRRAKVDALA